MKIDLNDYCNIDSFEAIIKDRWKSSQEADEVVFDFRNTIWIGPLQISQLHEWIRGLRNKDKRVEVVIKNSTSQAFAFLSRIGFLQELDRMGVVLNDDTNWHSIIGFAAFKTFANIDEMTSYENAISQTSSFKELLGDNPEEIDIIREGDFRDILLHELGQNAFIHGKGRSIRFCAAGFQENFERKKHQFLSTFNGQAYIEVVMSDAGPGIFRGLSKHVPSDYVPNIQPNIQFKSKKAKKISQIISYAMEFATTINVEDRENRLRAIYSEGSILFDAIPTGLFYVSSLCKTYGGQIIFRTDSAIVSFDYADADVPKLYVDVGFENIIGTHVLIRIPKKKKGLHNHQYILPTSRLEDKATFDMDNIISISLASIQMTASQSHDFILAIEKEVFDIVSKQQFNAPTVLVLLANSAKLDSKTFSILLMILGIIPRRRVAIFLLGVPAEYVDSARGEWDKISQIRNRNAGSFYRLHGFSAFILSSTGCGDFAQFGDEDKPGATRLLSDKGNSENGFTTVQVSDIYFQALGKVLKSLINSDLVRHPDTFKYLIEKKYYSETFFEIRKLLGDPIGRALSLEWLKLFITREKISNVLVISKPLFEICDQLESQVTGLKIFKKIFDNPTLSLAAAANSFSSSGPFAIFSDVVFTGSEVKDALSYVIDPKYASVLCFVDARNEEYSYFTLKREEKAYSVPVKCLSRYPIEPLYDLPKDLAIKVLIVDRYTHSPTVYDDIKVTTIKPNDILELAHKNNALLYGHRVFRGKHYTSFLRLPELFSNMTRQLHLWWDSTILKISIGKNPPKLSNSTVYYLDEKRGWESLVPQYFSSKGFNKCLSVTREMLYAPPENVPEQDFVWVIMPALASGSSTMRCLELASKHQPKLLVISIIVARIDSSVLAFYQNISGYKRCKDLNIDILAWFPIACYESTDLCPVCNTYIMLKKILKRVERFEAIRSAVTMALDQFVPREVKDDLFEEGGHGRMQLDKAILRANYEESRRSIGSRRMEFGPILDSDESCRLFLEVIGEEYLSPIFSRSELEKVTYSRFEKIKHIAVSILKVHLDSHINLATLLGINHIYPEVLMDEFTAMVKDALVSSNDALFKRIIVLSLIDSGSFADKLVSITSRTTPSAPLEKISKEVANFNGWYDTEISAAIDEYKKLLWLVRRSTPWGMNIEKVRVALSNPSSRPEDVSKLVQILSFEGVDEVIRCLHSLRNREKVNPGTLWSALITHDDKISKIEESLLKLKADLNAMVSFSSDFRTEKIADTLFELDRIGKSIRTSLISILTNPIDAKMKVYSEFKKLLGNAPLRCYISVAPDQPPVLFHSHDLILAIQSVIENAVAQVLLIISDGSNGAAQFWVKINFKGFSESGHQSVLEISDNIPWAKKIVPSGGLRQFSDYCRKYGAVCDFNPVIGDENPDLKIWVGLQIDKD